MEKAELISLILEQELQQFTAAKDINGQAPCQKQQGNFLVSRACQWCLYEEEILSVYWQQLLLYKQEKRNIVSEKYGYMMRQTEPAYFEKIAHLLPPISQAKEALVEANLTIMLRWSAIAQEQDPAHFFKTRRLYSEEDRPQQTSIETYLRGEYSTYSEAMLRLLLAYHGKALAADENLVSKIGGLYRQLVAKITAEKKQPLL